jgi:SNF2 family DNA or RNA helicase
MLSVVQITPDYGAWVLTGTPIQNNWGEMYALMDLVNPGLLGTRKHFKEHFEKPVAAMQDRNATERARQIGAVRADEFRKIIKPYMLRRTKDEVLGAGKQQQQGPNGPVVAAAAAAEGEAGGASGRGATVKCLPPKNDLVVWLKLQPLQEKLYELYLHSDDVSKALMTGDNGSALNLITNLKKICHHPALLNKKAAEMVMSGGLRNELVSAMEGK